MDAYIGDLIDAGYDLQKLMQKYALTDDDVGYFCLVTGRKNYVER